MALSGLDIYKLLPKTNCKKCGSPTCLAFAMRLATKKASIDECPDISDEARRMLDQAARPPIALITIGMGERKVEVGGETVLFRHEKTFYHKTAIAISVEDSLKDSALINRVKEIDSLSFERVGQVVRLDLIAIKNSSKDPARFAKVVKDISAVSQMGLILISEEPASIEEALKVCFDRRPLIHSATNDNWKKMIDIAKRFQVPLVVAANGLEGLDGLVREILKIGFEEIVLDPGQMSISDGLNLLTQIRRLALKKNYRNFGFPAISFVEDEDKFKLIAKASTFILKYAGIIVLNTLEKEVLLPLITVRQNIYTDPQKPVTVESKLYSIGAPNETSPVLVTTNFSLTFYTVSPEIETSGIPSYLLVTDSEGMSVLTAWAAEKFTAEIIAKTMQKFEVERAVKHRKIIIPGYVAVLSGKLEDESSWQVLVGPKEASGIPRYLKEIWKQ